MTIRGWDVPVDQCYQWARVAIANHLLDCPRGITSGLLQ